MYHTPPSTGHRPRLFCWPASLRTDYSFPLRQKYFAFRQVQLDEEARFTGKGSYCCINLAKVLYDREMSVVQDDLEVGKVSDEDWEDTGLAHEQLRARVEHLRQDVSYAESEELQEQVDALEKEWVLWERFSVWMKKILSSRDALDSPEGECSIKWRVISLYDQIVCMKDGDKIRLLELIGDHSDDCSDRAVVGLEKAETVVQLIHSDDKLVNVLVLMFKKYLIEVEIAAKSLSGGVDDQYYLKESLESYLFYCTHLREVLGLDTRNIAMLHDSYAVKYTFDEVIDRVFKRLTVDDLVGFIACNGVFRDVYHKEFMSYYNSMENLDFSNPVYLEKMMEDFYVEKSKNLLLMAGFIVEGTKYDDPYSFPSIPHIFREGYDAENNATMPIAVLLIAGVLFGSVVLSNQDNSE